jgi:restriction system protein
MPIPDFQTIMLPLLRQTSNGQEHLFRDLVAALEDEFHLTPEERAEMLPSGGQRLFRNRVGWARFHLVKANLLDAPRRGIVRITDRGRQVLAQNPSRVDMSLLSGFAEYREFRAAAGSSDDGETDVRPDETQTPEEAIEAAYARHREALASELLERIRSGSPGFFEELVVRLLKKMGYGDAASVTGRSGDEGIDGIIKEDRLGLDVIYVQAKRWENTVGRPQIQQFTGALHGRRARKGVFITASAFSREARDYVEHIDPRIVLIDGHELAELMIDHNVGVSPETSYELKRIDSDFFLEA